MPDTPLLTRTAPLPPGAPTRPFTSLRTKFVAFFSLILVVACSSLSWYFIESRRAAMVEELHRLGTILVASVAHNDHFRFAALVAEDQATMRHYLDGLLSIDEVVYVVISDAHGAPLAQRSKGAYPSLAEGTRSPETPLFPAHPLAVRAAQTRATIPTVTALNVVGGVVVLAQESAWQWDDLRPSFSETLYDFALPVHRSSRLPQSPFSLDPEPLSFASAGLGPPSVDGVIQIGLTDRHVRQSVGTMVWGVLALTLLIIAAGITGAHLLTAKITTPLRRLADVARQISEGSVPLQLHNSTNDEVGQLTHLFNVMARSVQDRNLAITTNLDTITTQVNQLTTLHQASAAITSTLNMHELLNTVLQLLAGNLGFGRMVLVLRHEDRDSAYVARVTGIPPDIEAMAHTLRIPIRDDGSLTAMLLLHHTPLLVRQLTADTPHIPAPILSLLQRIGVTSFIAVPLQSRHGTVGFLVGDRGYTACTDADLGVLQTIASHVAAAIDNARAYAHLSDLTQHQEERIRARTEELSKANEQLQAHDRRRSTFLSVVSHELRTPMTAIRSFTENMLDGVTGPLTPQQTTYLARIDHNVARLARIINQLLDWSRLDMQKEVLHPDPVCLVDIATTAADSLQSVAQDKQITLRILAPTPIPRVLGDRDKLEQILWNVIGNAIKFTPPGGSVTVSFSPDAEGMVETCVADTGCGIDPQHMQHIFDEFSKVPSPMPSAQGAQLGLCITKALVAMHHGTIRVDSTVGTGTRVCFTIPAARDAHRPKEGAPMTTTE